MAVGQVMDVSELIKSISAGANAPHDGVKEEERVQLIAACDMLKGSLETPLDITKRIIFSAHEAVALRLGVDMKLFDAIVESGGSATINELAVTTGADPLLILRILRLLTGMGILQETGKDTFALGPVAGAYVLASPLASAVIHITQQIEVLAKLPEYFMNKGYKNPQEAFDGPFQYATGTDLHYFDWIKKKPYYQNAFDVVMSISRLDTGEEWFDFYPVGEKLQAVGDRPLLIDVGGGRGHDLMKFHAKFPELSGNLILQDIPVVVDAIKDLPPEIQAMKYDFFTPQPIKGAKAYYLRTVLHDWPDKQAQQILNNIKDAMGKDSILLINENVLPESNVPLYLAQLDLSMMAEFSSLDRTITQFRALLDTVGFEVVQIWTPSKPVPGSGMLFEAKKRL